MKKCLKWIDDSITKIEKGIVAAGVLAASFIIFFNVISRSMLNHSFTWAEEMTRYIMVWVTFFGSNLCVQNNIHVKMDLLHVKLPHKAAKVLVSVSYFLCIAGCLFLTYFGWKLTMQIMSLGQVSTAMPWLKMWIVNIAIPIFGIIAIKDYCRLLIKNLISRDEIVKELGGEV